MFENEPWKRFKRKASNGDTLFIHGDIGSSCSDNRDHKFYRLIYPENDSSSYSICGIIYSGLGLRFFGGSDKTFYVVIGIEKSEGTSSDEYDYISDRQYFLVKPLKYFYDRYLEGCITKLAIGKINLSSVRKISISDKLSDIVNSIESVPMSFIDVQKGLVYSGDMGITNDFVVQFYRENGMIKEMKEETRYKPYSIMKMLVYPTLYLE